MLTSTSVFHSFNKKFVKQQEQSKTVSEQNHGLSQLKLQECSQFVTEETSGLISSLDTLEQWI
jgi:uncharacterized protein YbcC (UPF0753/DUF2309 family)